MGMKMTAAWANDAMGQTYSSQYLQLFRRSSVHFARARIQHFSGVTPLFCGISTGGADASRTALTMVTFERFGFIWRAGIPWRAVENWRTLRTEGHAGCVLKQRPVNASPQPTCGDHRWLSTPPAASTHHFPDGDNCPAMRTTGAWRVLVCAAAGDSRPKRVYPEATHGAYCYLLPLCLIYAAVSPEGSSWATTVNVSW